MHLSSSFQEIDETPVKGGLRAVLNRSHWVKGSKDHLSPLHLTLALLAAPHPLQVVVEESVFFSG